MTIQFETDIFQDMTDMHDKFKVHEWVGANPAKLREFMEFRLRFLDEELNETKAAVASNDPEEIVDGLIDLIVIAAGTLDAFNVDGEKAWNEVLRANMSKEVGVKETRPNPLGLPDLIKPEGWTAPDHTGNHGLLTGVYNNDND